ncbi:MAG: hypothetical protein P1U56_01635 [Saprospiraceae bacterium]|nr:hypothetical protein [Saprospiraceae bacterium]
MKWLLFIFFVVLSNALVGQTDLIQKKGSKYLYKEKIYRCQDLGVVLRNNPEAYQVYLSSRKTTSIANTMLYGGIASSLTGLVIGSNAEKFSRNATATLLFLGGGVIAAIFSLIPRGIANSKLLKSIKIFNFQEIEQNGYQLQSNGQLHQVDHGIGFVFNF